MTLQIAPPDLSAAEAQNAYAIRFPQASGNFDQTEEWCEVLIDGEWTRLRLHDYAEIYRRPGLYEYLFARLLRCTSPARMARLLADVLPDFQERATNLRLLDLGAGNGMVGAQMRRLGVQKLVGIDLAPEAAEAAERDRPGLYDDYVVADLCELDEADSARLAAADANCLTVVSALGFGDIPPLAFQTAFNHVASPGWLVCNIKETFLSGRDSTGFSRMIRAMSDRDIIQMQAYRRYSHRLSVTGKPLHYVAIIARKLKDIPEGLAAEVA
jgi:SAM-dependent methyltransferase